MPQFSPSTIFSDVYLITPKRFEDERGFFMESFRASWLENIAPHQQIVQENRSFSKAGVLRGLHYQLEQSQGKLIQLLSGEIYDVLVDMRQHSPTFGRWQGFHLKAESLQQLWVPAGFAHGFYSLRDSEVLYRCTHYYHAESERSLSWNDPQLEIAWPLLRDSNQQITAPLISAKDQQAVYFSQADYFQ